MLVQCLRRWPTINPALMEYFLFDMHTWMFWKPTRQYNTKARWCYRWFSLWPSTVAHGPVRLLWCLIQDKHHTGLKCVCNLVTWYTLPDNADRVLRFWGVLFSISKVAIPINCYHSYSPTHSFMLFNLFTTIHDGNFRRHSSINVTIKWHKFSSNIYYIYVFFVIWSWKLR